MAAEPEQFGRYLLLDRINVGGMAEVFRGKLTGVEGFERMVALKRILPSVSADPDFIEMFVDEAKLAVELQHANIAQTYELGKVGSQYFIAMEYVRGVDLRTIWDRARKRQRLLPFVMSAYVVQKVCEGLDYAHRKTDDAGRCLELVHRDVSPHNILCSFDGEVKLIDFGIAQVAHKVSKTHAGALKGKFGYMSPEQIRGATIDERTDIFACGIVLYELLVGRRLFRGTNDFSLLEKIRNVEFLPPSQINKDLDPRLEEIILRALQRQPEDRYPSASAMATDLQRFVFESETSFDRRALAKYMSRHFAQEIERERERMERFKNLARLSSPTEVSAPRPAQSSSRAVGLGDLGAEPEGEAAYDPPRETSSPWGDVAAQPERVPETERRERRSVPTWVAVLVGALLSLVLAVLTFQWNRTGTLTVQVTPESAEVSVDGRPFIDHTPVTFEDLAPGEHLLRVRADGHQSLTRTVTVDAGRTRIEVIHLEGLEP
ncbi:MAG: serine/threonine protein kinase [Myxococcota bacterium]